MDSSQNLQPHNFLSFLKGAGFPPLFCALMLGIDAAHKTGITIA